MIQPNLRGSILRRATTQFEQARMSEAHTDNDLRLKRRPEQTLVIAMPWDTGSGSSAHQNVRRDATLLHRLTASVKTEGLACGRTAPRPYLYEHEQTCPGGARAVS